MLRASSAGLFGPLSILLDPPSIPSTPAICGSQGVANGCAAATVSDGRRARGNQTWAGDSGRPRRSMYHRPFRGGGPNGDAQTLLRSAIAACGEVARVVAGRSSEAQGRMRQMSAALEMEGCRHSATAVNNCNRVKGFPILRVAPIIVVMR